ncbi:MAG: ABC transporter permease [Planctomycetaceae bacterium]
MLFRLFRTFRLALKSLMLHPLRSMLTMLGILFGVFSVIAMLAIGEGAKNQAQEQVLKLGATNIIILSVKPPEESSDSGERQARVKRYGLTHLDFKLLSTTIPTVTKAVQFREINAEARYATRKMNTRLVGCNTGYLVLNHLEMEQGRFISERDNEIRANVCVIAHEVAETLFPIDNPLGKTIRIKQNPYLIVGIIQYRTASAAIGGSLSGQDYNKDIYIPRETMASRVNKDDLDIQVTSGSFSAEKVAVSQITLQVARKEHVKPTVDVVRETLEASHGGKKDYAIVVPDELLKQAEQLSDIFDIVLGSIAAISLLVGGIGIMNIMLATVSERTREIGIRRALGAKQRDITTQFLTETVVLSGTGGLVGILLGLATPSLFVLARKVMAFFGFIQTSTTNSEMGRMFANIQPEVSLSSIAIAFGISAMVGIIFGLYPAVSAAKLDPIEALRHE